MFFRSAKVISAPLFFNNDLNRDSLTSIACPVGVLVPYKATLIFANRQNRFRGGTKTITALRDIIPFSLCRITCPRSLRATVYLTFIENEKTLTDRRSNEGRTTSSARRTLTAQTRDLSSKTKLGPYNSIVDRVTVFVVPMARIALPADASLKIGDVSKAEKHH